MHLHGGSVPHGNVDLSSRLRRNCLLNFVPLAFQRAGTHGAALWRGGRRGLRRSDQLGALNRGDARIARGPQRAAMGTEVPLGVSGPLAVTLSHADFLTHHRGHWKSTISYSPRQAHDILLMS